MPESSAFHPVKTDTPGLSELFFAFLGIAMTGFGGVMPWARRMLVEKRGWLSEEKFAEDLALAQFLPGPNIVNLSIVVGGRFQGPMGAFIACIGLVGAPVALMMICGALYARYGDAEWLRGPLSGLSAAAAGLIIAMVAKLAIPMFRVRHLTALVFTFAAFLGVGFLRFPLWTVLLTLAPLSVAVFWWRRS
jgi:chromate transporter